MRNNAAEKTKLLLIQQIARWVLGFCWFYQGLVPKLVTISPTEALMTGRLGFNPEVSNWITRLAGVGEIVFAIVVICFYRNKYVLYVNNTALLVLLLFVLSFFPPAITDAFNAMTTNLPMIALGSILLVLKDVSLKRGS